MHGRSILSSRVCPTVARSVSTLHKVLSLRIISRNSETIAVGKIREMSSKILYRRVLPTQVSLSTQSHPHKPPSTTSHPPGSPSTPSHPPGSPPTSSHPLTVTDAPDFQKQSESTTDQDCSGQGGCPHNENVNVKLKPKVPEQGADESSSRAHKTVDQPSSKMTLGEITEIKGVIFDMDGTLTIPVLRFAEMKEKLGLKPTDDILPTVQKFPAEEREKAFKIIEEFEQEGVENMKLQAGVLDLFQYLAERDIRRALMTRNAWYPTNAFLKKLREELEGNNEKYSHLTSEGLFTEIITREFEPCKPHPASVLHICKQWSLEPHEVVVVGDDKTDMMCGLRAGVGVNILLRNERNVKQPNYSHFTVNALSEIMTLMSSLMTVPFKEVP